jgi:asparagine synthase (glutamine-hydrolysing)
MCGIAGTVGGPRPDPAVLARMAQRMVHRGPDSEGIWHDEVAGLVIRRLAIIDLDDRSNQPFHHGPWHLVFNGEIYNYRELRDELRALGHRFETEGDGEVLLRAWVEWEDGALDRLNGMFAVAIWHDERRELILASDPFGEKPLYWAGDCSRLAFASDIRALLEVRADLGAPRADAIAPFLALGWMPPIDRSFFADVARLPGAHILRVRDGRIALRRYWQPRRVDVEPRYDACAERLRELLLDSIRLRLRSDVPVGTSLSGGIDSSAVVCLSAQIAGDHRRHAYTARFRGFERDEWRYADVVAQAAGVVEHHSVEPQAADLLVDLERVVVSQEEPFGSASIYAQWRVMQAARQSGVTVLLDGQGADELFGGYVSATGWAIRSQGPAAVARGLASPAARKPLLLALGAGTLPKLAARLYRRRGASDYAAAALQHDAASSELPTPDADGFASPLARELLRQTLFTRLPDLLRYADRSSMAHSREVRLPFLDRRIAEFALSLPAGFLYRDGLTKAILRDAVRGLVPQTILARRDKIGYEPPQARWFSEPAFVARICEVLLDSQARARGYYDSAAIEADARAGRWRDPNGIWRALNLELWLSAFSRSGQPTAPLAA